MARDSQQASAPGGARDLGALLLAVLEQTSLRLILRDDEGRFLAFGDRPEILPVGRGGTLGRASWDGAQYLGADGRVLSMLEHPAQEARRTGMARPSERLGLRFTNGEEHWFLGDFVPVAAGASGHEVLSVLYETTPIETERREALEQASALRQALAVAVAVAGQSVGTPHALAEAVREPLSALLPGCHVALGLWTPDGEWVHLFATSELEGMAPFEARTRRSPDVKRRVGHGQVYVDNDLQPTDIVGRRAIGTDVVPARSVCLVPFPGTDGPLGVMVIYHPRPQFFGEGLVAALEAVAPAIGRVIAELRPGWERAA